MRNRTCYADRMGSSKFNSKKTKKKIQLPNAKGKPTILSRNMCLLISPSSASQSRNNCCILMPSRI